MTPRQTEPETGGTAEAPRRRTVLTALGGLPVAAAAAPALGLLGAPSAAAATDVLIDISAGRQTIRGFGGMAHAAWIGDLTAAQRDTAFGNAEGQLGFSVLRIPVPEDRANWSRDLTTAQRAGERGALVFASPWNPPAHMTETFVRGSQTDAKRLRYDMYAAYAQHLNDFTAFMRDNGVELYAISVQNEPDYAHDWTWWTSAEMVRFLRENAGTISTRVIAPESFQYIKSASDPILNDPAALANVDIVGAHLYGTPYGNFPYPLFREKGAGKDLWMTEVYHPNSSDSADLWPQALDVGQHIHHAMVDAEFQTYVWWYIRRSYGPLREDGVMSKRGANMAHFAKFVRPGFVRLDAPSNPQSDVYTSVYRGDGSTVVVVAVNKGAAAVSQGFTLASGTVSGVSSWVTDASRNVAPQGQTGGSGASFTGQLPARSVTTFVLTVGPSTGGDTQAPTAPGTPSASQVAATSVTLSWGAATDNVGVAGYDVVRLGGTAESPAGSSTTNRVTVTGLSAGTAYTFAVYARDAAGNRSPRSGTVAVTTADAAAGACGVSYRVVGDWGSGFQGEIVLRNTGSTAIEGWTLAFDFTAGQTVSSMWGGTPAQTGGTVRVTPADWSRTLPAGGSLTIGFVGTRGGTNPAPTAFTLNGGSCATT